MRRRVGSEDMKGFSNRSYHRDTNSSLVIVNDLVVDIPKDEDDIDDQHVELPDENMYKEEVEIKSNNMLKNRIVEPCDSIDRRVFTEPDVQEMGNVAVLRRNAVVENGNENTFQHLKRYIVQQNVDEYF